MHVGGRNKEVREDGEKETKLDGSLVNHSAAASNVFTPCTEGLTIA